MAPIRFPRPCRAIDGALGAAFVAAALFAVPFALPGTAAHAQEPPKDFSPAERALFMNDQLTKLHPPMTLRYRFKRAGSLEPAFEDKVSVALRALPDGKCCAVEGDFLSGERKVALPPVEHAEGNPVTLFFLERDVREMERMTKGKQAYFRKRIRMAVFDGAQQRPVSLRYRGKAITGQEFTINPYLEDPNRPRFEQLATKRYVFTLSDAVPGMIYAIRTVVADTAKGADASPLIAEELVIDGAETEAAKAGS